MCVQHTSQYRQQEWRPPPRFQHSSPDVCCRSINLHLQDQGRFYLHHHQHHHHWLCCHTYSMLIDHYHRFWGLSIPFYWFHWFFPFRAKSSISDVSISWWWWQRCSSLWRRPTSCPAVIFERNWDVTEMPYTQYSALHCSAIFLQRSNMFLGFLCNLCASANHLHALPNFSLRRHWGRQDKPITGSVMFMPILQHNRKHLYI